MTTENVTTSGPTATATLSGLSNTEYRVEIRGITDVISQAIPISVTFTTLGGTYVYMWYWTGQSEKCANDRLIYMHSSHSVVLEQIRHVQ